MDHQQHARVQLPPVGRPGSSSTAAAARHPGGPSSTTTTTAGTAWSAIVSMMTDPSHGSGPPAASAHVRPQTDAGASSSYSRSPMSLGSKLRPHTTPLPDPHHRGGGGGRRGSGARTSTAGASLTRIGTANAAATALASQTVAENERMARIVRQLHRHLSSGNDGEYSDDDDADDDELGGRKHHRHHRVGGGGGRGGALVKLAGENAPAPSASGAIAREAILRELLDLQCMVDAARTGDLRVLTAGPTSAGASAAVKALAAELDRLTGANSSGGGGTGGAGVDGMFSSAGADGVADPTAGSAASSAATAAAAAAAKRREPRAPNLGTVGPAMGGGMVAGLGGRPQTQQGSAGRKSIRIIAEELAEKIALLRTNPSQWEIFCARVAAYKASKRFNRQVNALQKNVDQIAQFEPETRREWRSAERQKHEERRQLVSAESKRLFEERQRHRIKLIEKSQRQLKAKPVNQKLYQLQYKWLVLGSLASRFMVMETLISQSHVAFLMFRVKSTAARQIQRAWARYKKRREEKLRRHAFHVISRFVVKHIEQRREKRKQQAANTIRDFFKEIHDAGKLLKIIKKFRFSVITAQRISKSYLVIRAAQMRALTIQWERMEPEYSNGLKTAMPESMSDLKSSKGKKSGKKRREESKDDKSPDYTPVPAPIRNTILSETLTARRKQFNKDRVVYGREMAKFVLQFESEAEAIGMPDAPKRPVFHLVLPRADMMELIKRGYLAVLHGWGESEQNPAENSQKASG
ncbi:hypothetical protein BC828DRAFT_378584 [Blastocladiella britannica]|nr:hypothetical protein BC828DRAFT_378584 [Blastocladiella britannica]